MKIWKTRLLSVALGLSLLAPTGAFAADAVTGGENTNKGIIQHRFGDGGQRLPNKDQILDLVDKYAPESMQEWEDALEEQEQLLNQFKEEHMQQTGISDETREKIKAIHEAVQNGDIDREEAREQLKELGVNGNFADRPKLELSDEAKEKMKDIREAVQNGDIDREEAREQLQELGVGQDLARGGPMFELNEAVQANDELKIKELLAQLLERLQERNQQLSARLS